MKRVFDIILAVCALVVALPLLAAVALCVRLFMGSPILFRQTRPGRGGRPFELVKFRTMRSATGAAMSPANDANRLTRFGRFLRASSLDELPELWNVLKGEMSFVGPRPLLMQYLDRYSPRQMRRHEVRPGLTGWAQVNGRNAVGWPEKLEMDVWYVENQSFMLDLKILALTALRLVAPRGISAPGHDTAPEFMGNDPVGGEEQAQERP
jgi:lipopolysaccharide/colanic/teichoic acid biosynthesis glycosyltransferase